MHAAQAITTHPLRMRLVALVRLLVWFAAIPGLLPGAAAALGSLDAQHRVQLRGEGGRILVILHHAGGVMASQHQHAPLAALLTVLAQPSGPTRDHVLSFVQRDDAIPHAYAMPLVAVPLVCLPPRVIALFSLPAPRDAFVPIGAPRPPPFAALTLLCLRSTTLLV